ncbi:MAG: hypothetical protein E6Q97_08905 [Desulfurellales bacterium]|nr:MAG: hypothetical protein E6Q97_08905 [Desulfurellales bacterium]
MDREELIAVLSERIMEVEPTWNEGALLPVLEGMSDAQLEEMARRRSVDLLGIVGVPSERDAAIQEMRDSWTLSTEAGLTPAQFEEYVAGASMEEIRNMSNVEPANATGEVRRQMWNRSQLDQLNATKVRQDRLRSDNPWLQLMPNTNRPYSPTMITVPGLGEIPRHEWMRRQLTGGFGSNTFGLLQEWQDIGVETSLTRDDFVMGGERVRQLASILDSSLPRGLADQLGEQGGEPPTNLPSGNRFRGQSAQTRLENYLLESLHVANTMTPWEMESFLIGLDRDDLMVWQARAQQLGFMVGTPTWGVADASTVEAFSGMIQTWAASPPSTLEEFMQSREDWWFQRNRTNIEQSRMDREASRAKVAGSKRIVEVRTTWDEELNATLDSVSRTLFGMGRGVLTDEERAAIVGEIQGAERAQQTATIAAEDAARERELAQFDAIETLDVDTFIEAASNMTRDGGFSFQNTQGGISGDMLSPTQFRLWAKWLGLDPNDRSPGNRMAVTRAAAQALFDTYGNWDDVARHWVTYNWSDQSNQLTPGQGRGRNRLTEQADELFRNFSQTRSQRQAELEAQMAQGVPATRIIETNTIDPELMMARRAVELHPDVYGSHALGMAGQEWVRMLTEGR